jgi:hypothetical protein
MKKMYLAVVLLASLVLGACSDDKELDRRQETGTEETYSEAPVWQVDWHYNQERPNWQKPDGSLYQNWTTIMVQIEDALKPYVSKDDLMALFVNGELRGLAKPAVDLTGALSNPRSFVMKAYGNEAVSERVNIKLSYYCQKLKHIFTLSDDIKFDSEEMTGLYEDFIPPFTEGATKYTVKKDVDVESILRRAGITPAAGNLIGAFAGEECRGVATVSDLGSASVFIFGRSAGEQITLRYYDVVNKRLYSIANALTL